MHMGKEGYSNAKIRATAGREGSRYAPHFLHFLTSFSCLPLAESGQRRRERQMRGSILMVSLSGHRAEHRKVKDKWALGRYGREGVSGQVGGDTVTQLWECPVGGAQGTEALWSATILS